MPQELLPATAAEWAPRIELHQRAAVESIVAIGSEFIAAKAALPHGEFGKLGAIVGMSDRTVRKFVAIARHSVLADRSNWSGLPASWTTLYELSQVPELELRAALDSGAVGPATGGTEAHRLAELTNRPTIVETLAEIRTGLPEGVELDQALAAYLLSLPPDELDAGRATLRAILDGINAALV